MVDRVIHPGIRSLVVNATYLFTSHIYRSLVRGIYAFALAYFLGPSVYGLFSYGISWYLVFLPFTYLGLDSILSHRIGKTKNDAAKLVTNTLTLRIIVTLIAALASGFTGWWIEPNHSTQLLLIVFSAALFGRSLAIWANWVFIAYEASRYTFRQEIIFRSLEATLGIIVLLMGGDLILIASIHALTWWLQAIFGIVIVNQQLVYVRLGLNFRSLLSLLFLGIPLGLAGIFEVWLIQGPLVIFRHLGADPYILGQLALVLQGFYLTLGISYAISRASLPVLSRSIARQDSKARLFMGGMLRVALIFGTSISLLGMAIAPSLVNWCLGENFYIAGQSLGPALFLLIPMLVSNAAFQILIAHDRTWSVMLCAALGALVMTKAIMVSSPAAAEVISILQSIGCGLAVWMTSLVLLVFKECKFNIRRSIIRPTILMVLALLINVRILDIYSNVIIATLISFIFIIFGILSMRILNKNEKETLLKVFRKFYTKLIPCIWRRNKS